MLTFILSVVIVGSVITIAMCLHNYRNPRKAWDRQHGSEMKGGEPTEAALAKIQRNAILAMIFAPVLMTIAGVAGYLKLEQLGQGDKLLQQPKWNLAEFKRWGKLANVQEGMTVWEVEAVMGPGKKKIQPDGEYLWWHQRADGKDRQLYVSIKDGKVAGKGARSGAEWVPFSPPNTKGEKPPPEGVKPKPPPDDLKTPAATKGPTAEMIKAELKKFEGTWKAVSVVIDGKPYPEDELKKQIWLQDDQGNFEVVSEGKVVNEGKAAEVDPTQTPAVIKGEDYEGKYHGIYRVVGDTVEECTAKTDKPRPTEFASKPGSGHWHEKWKRVSKVKQVELIQAGKPPTAERVARRALVLTLMMYRASLEQFAGNAKYEAHHAKLPAWIDKLKLLGELEKEEHEFLRASLGKADKRVRADASWRAEGSVVLAWALKLHELPAHDDFWDVKKLADSMGFNEGRLAALDTSAAEKVIRDAKLRPSAELDRMRTRVTIIHWRLRQYRLSPEPMDYLGYLKAHPSFKKAWLENLPLKDGELVIAKKAIADADKETVRQCESIAVERQIAVYWLAGDGPVYSKIDPATILTGLP